MHLINNFLQLSGAYFGLQLLAEVSLSLSTCRLRLSSFTILELRSFLRCCQWWLPHIVSFKKHCGSLLVSVVVWWKALSSIVWVTKWKWLRSGLRVRLLLDRSTVFAPHRLLLHGEDALRVSDWAWYWDGHWYKVRSQVCLDNMSITVGTCQELWFDRKEWSQRWAKNPMTLATYDLLERSFRYHILPLIARNQILIALSD